VRSTPRVETVWVSLTAEKDQISWARLLILRTVRFRPAEYLVHGAWYQPEAAARDLRQLFLLAQFHTDQPHHNKLGGIC
jgi:hypothetical protein